ncbi:MAG: hypothetical protein QOH53_461 [Ilumatobacteraceae bacterium]
MNRMRGALAAIVLALAVPVVAASPTTASAADPATIDGLYAGAGPIGQGVESTMSVLGRGLVPASGVGAVALNVTVTNPTMGSFLTVWPTGSPRPLASNLNFVPGQTVANAVLTKVGSNGKISIFNNGGSVDVVIDVVGWFPDNQAYVGVTPARLLDSRNLPTIDGQFSNTGALGQGGVASVKVVGRGSVPPSGVGAVALNVTATNPSGSSFVTVWPAGGSRPTASNINFVAGQTVPNLVVAKVGDGGQVSIYNNTGAVDVVVDVLGWFPSGGAFTPLMPARLLDTRSGSSIVGAATRDVQISGLPGGPPSGAAAVALNVTVTNPGAPSFLTVWPSGNGRPLASNLNFSFGQTVANTVIVKLGTNGKVSLFTPANADVVIDVLGWFPATGSFSGVVPARLMDTRREPSPLTPGTSWQWQIDGSTIDETVLDGVANPKKMYDIDMFTSNAGTIQRLHAKGIYVVCYVETGAWENNRPDASSYPQSVLGNAVPGYPNERLVDIRQIAVLQPIMAARFDQAKAKGCDGIEPDLDDTYNGYNTGFPLTMPDQLNFNKAVADLVHARGMSIGLKNGASSGGVFERAMVQFTDWALNEECNQFGECGGYSVYIAENKAVFQVEYIASGAGVASICPADNAANFDGILKLSSESLAAQPRTACRNG